MGKSSGSDRNTRRESSNSNFRIGTGVFGENETWRISVKGRDGIGIYPKKLFTQQEALSAFKKSLKAENKSEKLPKFQNDGKTYDLNDIKKQLNSDFRKRNKLIDKGEKWEFVKFEKSYDGGYNVIYNSPRQKKITMRWSDLKRQLK